MDVFTITSWFAAGLVGAVAGTMSAMIIESRAGLLFPGRLFLGGLVAIFITTFFWIDLLGGKVDLEIFTDESLFSLFLLSMVVALVTHIVLLILFHINQCKRQRTQSGRTV